MSRRNERFSFKAAWVHLPHDEPLGVDLLEQQGISAKQASALVRSGWLQRLGRGAYRLPGDQLDLHACLAFLAQRVPGLHVAGKTALAWRRVRHNLAFRETVILWGDAPARLPAWFTTQFEARYRVAHIFDASLPAGLGLAPLPAGRPDLLVSTPERALLELLSEVGSFESLEEARHLVEGTRHLREDVLDHCLTHLTRIKVARLAYQLARELDLPWQSLALHHSQRLGGGQRWVSVGRTGERLDLRKDA